MLGIGALASLGLALPTGMAFGYGYGYGVRAGYNAYKQPSHEVQKLKLSPNPVTGALGAGLQSAEERTGTSIQGLTLDDPAIQPEKSKLVTDREYLTNKKTNQSLPVETIVNLGKKHGLSELESRKKFGRGEYPFNFYSHKKQKNYLGRR